MVKNPPTNAEVLRQVGSIPELRRSPGEGNGNLPQYSCLENPMDRGAWWATVHGVAKSWTLLKQLQFSSVAQSCPTLCNPEDCSMPGFPVHRHSWNPPKLMSTESVMPSNHLILCCPLLLLPSIFPSIRVFPKDLALHIRWPKYWSFDFGISPFNAKVLEF